MELVGRPAIEIADAVRLRKTSAVDVVRAHLDHLEAIDDRLGAFVSVRRAAALEDAEAVDADPEVESRPLAGVPVALEDSIDLTGEPTRFGSRATSVEVKADDAPPVAALRAAGAVVIGKTRCPELGLWGTSEDHAGVAVSPWDPSRSAGGSAGGSGAAVGAGIVPLGLATDGLGSVRIPAAANGCVGIKPGDGLLPLMVEGEPQWFGMSRFGPIATTVGDVALALDVMVGTSNLRTVTPVDRRLTVAVSWATPAPGFTVSRAWVEVAIEAGRLCNHAGHEVRHADPPYDQRMVRAAMSRWLQGVARDVELRGLNPDDLQPRTRSHVAMAGRAAGVMVVRDEDATNWRDKLMPFFDEHDVLITPTLARAQPKAEPWHERSWTANAAVNLNAYPYPGAWNLADLPAAAVPLWQDGGRPLSVQIVGGPGRQDVVLALAAQLEQLTPWARHAPGWGVPAG